MARQRSAGHPIACNWTTFDKRYEEFGPTSKQLDAIQALLDVLTDEYDPAAIQLMRHFTDHESAAIRVRVVQVLARVYKERKPYPGTWWGTRPEQQKPPARNVEWEGTPLVREAILKALGDKDVADVLKAAVLAALLP